MSSTILKKLVSDHQNGLATGITSICSANPWVIDASIQHAVASGQPLLLESTSNQVNQTGGYTGQTPAQFAAAVRYRAEQLGLPGDRLILGGDHLGPNPWQGEPAAAAMEKSLQMIHDYVAAGYTKIHLDASMKCADDDPTVPLSKELSAARSAEMARVAEETAVKNGLDTESLVYIVGTEVPIPGGSQEHEETLQVTTPEDAAETLEISRQAFHAQELQAAWERVIALVVQPGVEFGDDTLFPYDRQAATPLSQFISQGSGQVFEAHSTDYQSPAALRQLVEDHFAILKVGPALTFAMREAVYALADIETEWLSGQPGVELSAIKEVLEAEMLAQPGYWQKHYHGTPQQQRFARRYSFSDRIRYYWPQPAVQAALDQLIRNLSAAPLPNPLLSQYLPCQYQRVRAGELAATPQAMIHDKIAAVLDEYAYACGNADSP